MIRRHELTEAFWSTETPASEREAWRVWAERHGLDRNNVAIPGWVEADDDARTVTALTLIAATDHAGPLDGVWLHRIPVTIQLEAPALPFPESEMP